LRLDPYSVSSLIWVETRPFFQIFLEKYGIIWLREQWCIFQSLPKLSTTNTRVSPKKTFHKGKWGTLRLWNVRREYFIWSGIRLYFHQVKEPEIHWFKDTNQEKASHSRKKGGTIFTWKKNPIRGKFWITFIVKHYYYIE
jgi:hypothetical protein